METLTICATFYCVLFHGGKVLRALINFIIFYLHLEVELIMTLENATFILNSAYLNRMSFE